MVIVGIDEVGRGCWAGPVVAGAVILNKPLVGLKDSKQLSKKQREKLIPQIQLSASVVDAFFLAVALFSTISYAKSFSLKVFGVRFLFGGLKAPLTMKPRVAVRTRTARMIDTLIALSLEFRKEITSWPPYPWDRQPACCRRETRISRIRLPVSRPPSHRLCRRDSSF